MVQKFSGLNSCLASWKTHSFNPAVYGYLFFESGKDKAQKEEGWAGFAFHMMWPKCVYLSLCLWPLGIWKPLNIAICTFD